MRTEEFRAQLIADHSGSQYYKDAESDIWIKAFWGEDTVFIKMFSALDLLNVVDLACGYGRHTEQIIDRAGRVTLVDANPECILACRARFASRANVDYLLNSGTDLAAIGSESMTSVFSYDAMVHFEPLDVIAYINEISRVLVPGGRALLHYSNADDNFQSYKSDPGWRNFFSEKMMKAFAFRAGLDVVESVAIPWGDTKDAVTLLQKPGA